MKLAAHRAGLPGNEISFLIVPLDPAYKAGLAGHLPAKPVDNSTTRTIKLPHLSFYIHLNFGLWDFFSEEIPDEGIESYVSAVQEIFGGFDVPISYLASKIKPENKFECFAPMRLRGNQEIDYLIDWLRNYCDQHRNPILKSTIVKNRRKTV